MTTDERIYSQAISDGMPPVLATLIVAQARHETGGYFSNAFRNCNNCFGYKWVGQSTAVGPCIKSTEGDYYAKYSSIEQSTHELTQWIRRRQNRGIFPQDLSEITSADQYASLLQQGGFYGNPSGPNASAELQIYINGLVTWLTKIGSTPAAATGAGAILLILIALGIVYRKKLFS